MDALDGRNGRIAHHSTPRNTDRSAAHGSVKVAPLAQHLDHRMPGSSPVGGVGGQKWRGSAFLGEFPPKRRERGERLRVGVTARGPGLRVLGALQTQHRQDLVGLGGQAPERGFDVRDVEEAQETDGEVAQAGECARGMSGARPAAILVIGHVPHVVQAVLDAPMAPVLGQELRGAGLCLRLARDQIDALEGGLVATDVEDLALDTGHLGRMGKRHIAV